MSLDLSSTLGNFFDLLGDAALGGDTSSSSSNTPYYLDPSSNLLQTGHGGNNHQTHQHGNDNAGWDSENIYKYGHMIFGCLIVLVGLSLIVLCVVCCTLCTRDKRPSNKVAQREVILLSYTPQVSVRPETIQRNRSALPPPAIYVKPFLEGTTTEEELVARLRHT